MIKRLAPLLLAVGLLACHGKSSSTTPSDGPSCADVGANIKAHFGEAGLGEAQVDEATEVVVTSCNDDAWSADARKCGAEAKGKEFEDCKHFLSADINDKLDAKMEAIFDEHAEPPSDPTEPADDSDVDSEGE